MFRTIDSLLNKITMYRLLCYGLGLLTFFCIMLALTGTLSFSAGGMMLSLGLLLVSSFVTNWALAHIWKIPSNSESWLISSLILFFILPQATTVERAAFIFMAGVIAMASKYLINWQGKHIFNPAAFAASVLSTTGLMGVTWWVGSSLLWPFTLIFGLLVVRKTRKFPLLISFAIASLVASSVVIATQDYQTADFLKTFLISSPLIFLGTIMLTEPSTMPPIRRQQVIFGTIVGLLFAAQLHTDSFSLHPELALLIGNLYAFAVSPKYRLRLKLKEVQKISDRIYNYVFTPDHKLAYSAGQYMEWTMHTAPKHDDRGNRRTFTIASSPTEDTIQLGVKFYKPSSVFKQMLRDLRPGAYIYAGQVGGNFTLPRDANKKLVLIAGGIGITPFRSMLKYLVDSEQKRDVTLFYLVTDKSEIVYKDVIDQAKKHGLKFVPIVATDATTKFNRAVIKHEVPDYTERIFYLSGPQGMVDSYKDTLTGMGVARTHIETDYFSGY